MKKQLNPTIKAHLIRSAFYFLLLLGVLAIPFALAQRQNSSKHKSRWPPLPRIQPASQQAIAWTTPAELVLSKPSNSRREMYQTISLRR